MNKITLLGICVVTIGLIALPETVSLFSNQHTWYNTTDIYCEKCHGDVSIQMIGNNTPHSEMTCKNCHQINMIQNGIHAATLPQCINCHNGNMNATGQINSHQMGITTNCLKCHDEPGMKTGLNISGSISNTNEAHRMFIVDAEKSVLMQGSNEACIGCHTATQVNITWKKPTTLSFDVIYNNSRLEATNFTQTGTNTTTTSSYK